MAFSYLPGAAADPDFFPLEEFPDLSRSYVSNGLPGFFANRVMSTHRASYPSYRSWLGLAADGADTPIEVLARTGGPRATDTFHVVDVPGITDGRFESRFFVSGIRHVEGSAARLASLSRGSELGLRPEPDNRVNPTRCSSTCVEVRLSGGCRTGSSTNSERSMHKGNRLRCFVEQVNPDAPAHLRLLVRLESEGGQRDR